MAAAVVLAGSVASSVGWYLGMLGSAGVVPGWRTVNPNATLVVLLVASGLVVRIFAWSRASRALVIAISLCAAGTGLASVSASLGGPGAGLPLRFEYRVPGAGPSQAMIGSVFLAAALCLSRARTTRGSWLFLVCAVVPALLGATAMIGQLYGANPLFRPFGSRTTAPITAAGLLLLAFGLVVVWMPARAWELVTASVPSGVVLRRVLPVSLSVLLVVGYAALRASQAGLLDEETEVAVIVAVSGLVLTVLMVWVGLQLNRSGLEATKARREADAATAALHARALELNEEVVQKLSVAWLADDSGDTQLTRSSVQESLRQAQRITRRLREADRETLPQPGDLRLPSRPTRHVSTADP